MVTVVVCCSLSSLNSAGQCFYDFSLTLANSDGCISGFPILSHFLTKPQTTQGGFNLGGINATGQVPLFPTNFELIDKDTPAEAYTKKPYTSQDEYVLVFSDEFNTDGRTFYPGDDPFWEAVDLHYCRTACVIISSVFGTLLTLGF